MCVLVCTRRILNILSFLNRRIILISNAAYDKLLRPLWHLEYWLEKFYINFKAWLPHKKHEYVHTELIHLIWTPLFSKLFLLSPQELPDGNYLSTHILIKQLNWKFHLTLNLILASIQLFEKVLLVFSTAAPHQLPSVYLDQFSSSTAYKRDHFFIIHTCDC